MSGMTTVKVLVVDDDPDFVLLIKDLLEDATRASFLVESASTISEGVCVVEKHPFDVVLLDYRLPDGDGIQFLEALEQKHIKTPVVIVTSRGDKSVQVKALEAGAVEYLSKGSFTAEHLEVTCIYAIGMQEKRNQNGGGPGVGMLIEQLVELTRDSVKSQTEATAELRETRKDLINGFTSLKADIQALEEGQKNRRVACEKEHSRVIGEIQGQSGFRWILDWVKKNTRLSVALFVCALLTVVLAVILLGYVDTAKIRDLTGAVPAGVVTTPAPPTGN